MKGLGYRTVMGWLRKTAIALGLLLLFAQCAKQLSPAEAAMSSAQQKKAHKGICSVTAGRAVADTVDHIIQVFLMINYADSVQEEIVVPMVERGGEWKMK